MNASSPHVVRYCGPPPTVPKDMSVACRNLSFRLFSSYHGFSNERFLDSGLQRFGKESDGVTLHLKLRSVTPVATKVHVIL